MFIMKLFQKIISALEQSGHRRAQRYMVYYKDKGIWQ